MNRKIVFDFSSSSGKSPKVLGGKGYWLARLSSTNTPVPPGFTVATSMSRSFGQYGMLPKRFARQLEMAIRNLEEQTGRKFGDPTNPLLVSVRSGAQVSMPGMMDTILNLGINPQIAEGLAKQTNDKFAAEVYQRFIQMFSETVFSVKLDTGSTKEFFDKTGREFPEDPFLQLSLAILAVLKSWHSDRAKIYRKEHNIPDWWGTAVNVQAMVFGNRDDRSGTGVVFSRNVATGEKQIYGEWLENAQGEDIVAGVRTPRPISEMKTWSEKIYRQLEKTVARLEDLVDDVVDVEFTVESGKLYILQVRSAKRTPEAAVAIATQFVWEKRWTKEQALEKAGKVAREVERPGFDKDELAQNHPIGKGLPASPGCVSGTVVFSAERAMRAQRGGSRVILMRPDTSPDDLGGMIAAIGIVTATGGVTSHAAVVARSMNRPCIVGMDGLAFPSEDYASLNGTHIYEGDLISIDGGTGKVYYSDIPLGGTESRSKEVNVFLKWLKELEPPMPEPKVGFHFMSDSMSENFLLNEFYLVDAMHSRAIGTKMWKELAQYRAQVHTWIAECLACYIVVAVAGELRHAWGHVRNAPDSSEDDSDYEEEEGDDEIDALKARTHIENKYNVMPGNGRVGTQQKVAKKLAAESTEDIITFLNKAERVFSGFNWESGYGGKAWAKIAAAPVKFLRGDISHAVFCDHVFDLQHNNGSVFGKHGMLNGDRSVIQRQLNIKKQVSDTKELFRRLAEHGHFSQPTISLFNRGSQLKLW